MNAAAFSPALSLNDLLLKGYVLAVMHLKIDNALGIHTYTAAPVFELIKR